MYCIDTQPLTTKSVPLFHTFVLLFLWVWLPSVFLYSIIRKPRLANVFEAEVGLASSHRYAQVLPCSFSYFFMHVWVPSVFLQSTIHKPRLGVFRAWVWAFKTPVCTSPALISLPSLFNATSTSYTPPHILPPPMTLQPDFVHLHSPALAALTSDPSRPHLSPPSHT